MRIIKSIAVLLLVLFVIFPRQSAVIALIIGGRVVAPEASAILSHYCFGNGDTLLLSAAYVRRSPVVLRSLAGLKTGEVRRVVFTQREDWRLSYALNPFQVRKDGAGYVVFQQIKFAADEHTFTVLDLWFTQLVVKDNLVHVFACKPFTVVCRFTVA